MQIRLGRLKGKRLILPKTALRPTQDRVKLAIFNMLMPQIEGASVLELFAGSGALGFEALSLGAKAVAFVDSDKRATEAIKANIENLGLSEQASVFNMEAEDAIRLFQKKSMRFEIAFMDAPYREGSSRNCLKLIGQFDILLPTALAVVEYFAKDIFLDDFNGLRLKETRRYGDTAVSIYEKAGDIPGKL